MKIHCSENHDVNRWFARRLEMLPLILHIQIYFLIIFRVCIEEEHLLVKVSTYKYILSSFKLKCSVQKKIKKKKFLHVIGIVNWNPNFQIWYCYGPQAHVITQFCPLRPIPWQLVKHPWSAEFADYVVQHPETECIHKQYFATDLLRWPLCFSIAPRLWLQSRYLAHQRQWCHHVR